MPDTERSRPPCVPFMPRTAPRPNETPPRRGAAGGVPTMAVDAVQYARAMVERGTA